MEERSLNPYASPSVPEHLVPPRAADFDEAPFAGTVTSRHVAATYWTPNRVLAWGAFFFIAGPLALSAVSTRPVDMQSAWIMGGVLLVTVLCSLWFSLHLSFNGLGIQRYQSRLAKTRPWLVGQVHGSVNATCLTYWSDGFGMALRHGDLYKRISNRGLVIYHNGLPTAVVPTTCFMQSDWHSALDLMQLRLADPLGVVFPPPGSHVCSVPNERLEFLNNRLRGTRWYPPSNTAPIFLCAVLIYLFMSLTGVFLSVPVQGSLVVGFTLLYYVGTCALWSWHTRQQFANDKRGYFGAEKTDLAASWFTKEAAFCVDAERWLQIPMSFLTNVKIGYSCLEFHFQDIVLRFHREGFVSHAAWLDACQDAEQLAKSGTFG